MEKINDKNGMANEVALPLIESELYERQKKALWLFREAVQAQENGLEERLWEILEMFQNTVFYTARGLDFTYTIRGYEMFVSRKDKSITRATVNMSFCRAMELGGIVSGPKKLGTFGASYLYPVFLKIGVIKREG